MRRSLANSFARTIIEHKISSYNYCLQSIWLKADLADMLSQKSVWSWNHCVCVCVYNHFLRMTLQICWLYNLQHLRSTVPSSAIELDSRIDRCPFLLVPYPRIPMQVQDRHQAQHLHRLLSCQLCCLSCSVQRHGEVAFKGLWCNAVESSLGCALGRWNTLHHYGQFEVAKTLFSTVQC